MTKKKPPIGLQPKKYWQVERLIDIMEAVKRRWDAGYKIPVEWIEEYNELIPEVGDMIKVKPEKKK